MIRISEANLRRYVLDNVAGLSEPEVKLQADQASIAGYMDFAGTPVLVSARGRFVADGDQAVIYVVDALTVDGQPLPDQLAATLIAALGGSELFIDLGKFAMPLVLKQVNMRDGWLVIEAATPAR